MSHLMNNDSFEVIISVYWSLMSHFRGIDDRLEERMIKWMILWMIVRETGSITRWESTGIIFIEIKWTWNDDSSVIIHLYEVKMNQKKKIQLWFDLIQTNQKLFYFSSGKFGITKNPFGIFHSFKWNVPDHRKLRLL